MFAHTEGGAKLVGLQYTADNELVEYLNTFVQVIQDIQISRVEKRYPNIQGRTRYPSVQGRTRYLDIHGKLRYPEAEFKGIEPRLNYGWFHLKLYSIFQDLSRRSIETSFW